MLHIFLCMMSIYYIKRFMDGIPFIDECHIYLTVLVGESKDKKALISKPKKTSP